MPYSRYSMPFLLSENYFLQSSYLYTYVCGQVLKIDIKKDISFILQHNV